MTKPAKAKVGVRVFGENVFLHLSPGRLSLPTFFGTCAIENYFHTTLAANNRFEHSTCVRDGQTLGFVNFGAAELGMDELPFEQWGKVPGTRFSVP